MQGFHKLECFVTQGWKGLSGTNTLAYRTKTEHIARGYLILDPIVAIILILFCKLGRFITIHYYPTVLKWSNLTH